MDIYVRFFLSLLNARSPCRDCNSAIIPRLRTTYRTNLFASSYFCRTSGPHSGPILQQISCKTAAQGQAQDQFRSKLVFLPHFRTTRRTILFVNRVQNCCMVPLTGPRLAILFMALHAKQKRAAVNSAAPVLHCVRCVKKDRPY